jgi:membrane protein DedA with SNARE-associated domain
MPTVAAVFAWLTELPPGLLALAVAGLAFAENIVPPLPSDTLIGLLTFLSAAGDRPFRVILGALVLGSSSGGALVFALGRRYGADGLQQRLRRQGLLGQEAKLEAAYARYGLITLFVGRLVPGVRSIVPVFAGALRLPALRSLLVILSASVLWYGSIAWVAYQVGGDWPGFVARVKAAGPWGVGAILLVALVAGGWVWRARQAAQRAAR